MFYYLLAALAAPLLLLAEARLARARHPGAYGLAETVNDSSHFLGEMILTALLGLTIFDGYDWLMRKVALWTPPEHWAVYLLAFIALDFLYYVGHRACHRVAGLWALHVVHHQSTAYNLAVGLRGPWLSALQIAPFMVPLAVAGVPSAALFPLYAVHTVYKLLVHTRLAPRLGAFEWLLITPSLHRVHHGSDAKYIDKNFGGVFSVWDHLFGSFAPEAEEPRYGLGAPLGTFDPLAHNLAGFHAIALDASRAGGVRGFLAAVLGRPSSEASRVLARPSAPARAPAPEARPRGRLALSLAFAALSAAVLLFLLAGAGLAWYARLLAGAALLAALIGVNRRLDGRSSDLAPCAAGD